MSEETFGCLIDGRVQIGDRWGPVIDPATEQSIGRYAVADAGMVEAAVASAVAAAQSWRNASAQDRQAVLRALAEAVAASRDRLATLLTREQGKPLREAFDEIDACIRIFGGQAARFDKGDDPLLPVFGDNFIRTRTPLGVVAAILPWNAPMLLAAAKISLALVTGNAIIVKTAPTTPATTMALGALVADLLPAGLLQILGDDGEVGPHLVGHPNIAKIAFTGSTVTGQKILARGAETIKRVTAELGGNDPALVLPGADLQLTAAGLFQEAFVNCGQICAAIKRVYAHADIIGELSERLAAKIRATRVGNGLLTETDVGPLQNRTHFEKSRALYDRTLGAGTVAAQSDIPKGKGFYLPVTLMADLPLDHELLTQEQFCPILPLVAFTSVDEAIRLANDSPYGLTASVWSQDLDEATRVATRIDAGLVCINAHRRNATGQGIPLCKGSGLGWLGGDESVAEFVQAHLVAM